MCSDTNEKQEGFRHLTGASRGVSVDVGDPGSVPRERVERVKNQLAAAPVHGQLGGGRAGTTGERRRTGRGVDF